MPVSERKKITSDAEATGLTRASPVNSAIVSPRSPRRHSKTTSAKAPTFINTYAMA
jgi:hypothetical protein